MDIQSSTSIFDDFAFNLSKIWHLLFLPLPIVVINFSLNKDEKLNERLSFVQYPFEIAYFLRLSDASSQSLVIE